MARTMCNCEQCGAEIKYGQEVYANDHIFFKGKYFCDKECFKIFARTYSEELIETIDQESYRIDFCDKEDV